MKKGTLLLFMCILLHVNIKAQKGYEKSIETGYSLGIGDVSNNTFNFAMVNGYRFNPNFYIGAGVGFGYTNNLNGINITHLFSVSNTTEYRQGLVLIPIYAQIKINLTNSNVSPFLLANVGYTIDGRKDFGFMFAPTFGIDFKINDKQSIYSQIGFNVQNHKYSYIKDLGTLDWEISTKEENLSSLDVRVGLKF